MTWSGLASGYSGGNVSNVKALFHRVMVLSQMDFWDYFHVPSGTRAKTKIDINVTDNPLQGQSSLHYTAYGQELLLC